MFESRWSHQAREQCSSTVVAASWLVFRQNKPNKRPNYIQISELNLNLHPMNPNPSLSWRTGPRALVLSSSALFMFRFVCVRLSASRGCRITLGSELPLSEQPRWNQPQTRSVSSTIRSSAIFGGADINICGRSSHIRLSISSKLLWKYVLYFKCIAAHTLFS